MDREALCVLAWPYPRGSDLNPYARLMYSAFGSRARVRPYAPLRRVRLPVDVLHIQWPEAIFEGKLGRSLLGSAAKAIAVLRACRKVRQAGGAVVLTVHNIAPHGALRGAQHAIWRWYFVALLREVGLLVSLSHAAREAFIARYPQTAAVRWTVIPHPHYRTVFESVEGDAGVSRPDRGITIGMFGSIRPSKKVPQAIAVVRQLSSPTLSLMIAGKADPVEQGKVCSAAGGDDAISLRFETLSDKEFQRAHAAVDGILLNQDGTLNSGSVLTALSLDRPVIAPDVGSLREVQKQVGEHWLRLFEPPLTAERLLRAVEGLDIKPEARPELSAFDPARLSDLLFHEFVQAARRARQTS
jgi:beta-1,4-mannosyltransferase